MRTWFTMKKVEEADKAPMAEIMIYDSIGSSWFGENTVSASGFVAALKDLGEVGEITLRINSPGGDVFDGVAIYNAIKNHKAKVTAQVDGLAASAASFIAMAADRIVMPSNAFMLVHNASGMAMGQAQDMRSMADDLDRIDKSMRATYVARTRQTDAKVKALMKEDRLMDAKEAKELGFADEITAPVRIAARYSLHLLPKAAAERFRAVTGTEQGGPPQDAEVKKRVIEKLAVEAGFKSRSDVIGAEGSDPEENDKSIAADKAREKALGLLPKTLRAVTGAEQGDPPQSAPVPEGPGEQPVVPPAPPQTMPAPQPPAQPGKTHGEPEPHLPADPFHVPQAPVPAPETRPGPPDPAPSPGTPRTQAEVVDLNTAKKQGLEEHQRYVAAITDLCTLARAPERVGAYVRASIPVEQVRRELLDMTAQAGVLPQHPLATPQPAASAWGKITDKLNARMK